jgi:formylmethanofuran dehydrogenase subunit C
VKPLVLHQRVAPEQRLDLSPLTPQRLAGKSTYEISSLALQTTRRPVCVGDIFAISDGNAENIVIDGGSERFDRIGEGMNSGSIAVNGDAGIRSGRGMAGGRLTINGSSGHWTASGMKGGFIEVAGNVGDRLGGPLAGEMQGIGGGVVVVHGDAGERSGDRMRRGLLIIEGNAGREAGSRMLAGTLIVGGVAGRGAGYLLRRGTLVIGATQADLGPTFLDNGVHDLVALRLMAAYVRGTSQRAAPLLLSPLRRFLGDMALLGKGEIFVAVGS